MSWAGQSFGATGGATEAHDERPPEYVAFDAQQGSTQLLNTIQILASACPHHTHAIYLLVKWVQQHAHLPSFRLPGHTPRISHL
jgi:hypothetical protein